MGPESAECSRKAPTRVRGRAAKDANPSTLLTSPTEEELRRAPGAGPDSGPDRVGAGAGQAGGFES